MAKLRYKRNLAFIEVEGAGDLPLIESLKEKLTLKFESMVNKEEILIKAFSEVDGGLLIPRGLVSGDIDDCNWERVEIPFSDKFKLRPNQEEGVKKALKAGVNCILSASMGAGKTIMALYLASRLGYRTLVVVHSEALFNQWIDKIQEVCGLSENDIGIIRRDVCLINRPIVVGMLKTLALGKFVKRDRLLTHFGFTIYDEVHRVPTEKFNVVAGMFWDKHRLGLSGTVERKDNFHKLVEWHIGKVIRVDPDIVVNPKVRVFFVKFPMARVSFYTRSGDFKLPVFLNEIAVNKVRNLFIAKLIQSLYVKGRKVIVFSDRLQLLDLLEKYLVKAGIREVAYITGQVKNFTENTKVFLATYGSAGEGVDIPDLDAVVLATPRADVKQAVGRVLRPKDRTPLVFDIVDMGFDPIMGLYRSRYFKFYKKRGWDVEENILDGEVLYQWLQK